MSAIPAGKPWYREPWPWLLMAGPAAVVVAGTITAVIAFRMDDSLVVDDYYKQGLAVNRVIAREEKAAALHVGATLQFSPARDRVRVLVTPAGAAPERITLKLTHPTLQTGDRRVDLVRESPGVYGGTMEPPRGNVYRYTLEDVAGQWRLAGRWKTVEDQASAGVAP